MSEAYQPTDSDIGYHIQEMTALAGQNAVSFSLTYNEAENLWYASTSGPADGDNREAKGSNAVFALQYLIEQWES